MRLFKYIVLFGIFIGCIQAAAMPIIIDNGETVDIEPYLIDLFDVDNNPLLTEKDLNYSIDNTQQALPFDIFPIKTPSMQVGEVPPQSLEYPLLINTIFLIGSDDVSLQWLQTNYSKLVDLDAIGWLIQADEQTDLETVQALAGELIILPMSAETLVEPLSLTYYPVVITHDSIWQ